MNPFWKHAATALKFARLWLVVGYSLPEFDRLVRRLLQESSADTTAIHVFDPDNRVIERFRLLLPGQEVVGHAGLPVGLAALDEIVRDWCDHSRDALAKVS